MNLNDIESGDCVRRHLGPSLQKSEYLHCVIRHQPDWFLNKLDFLLHTNHFIAAHYTMIHQELLRAGITAKKLKKVALEHNENVHEFIWSNLVLI